MTVILYIILNIINTRTHHLDILLVYHRNSFPGNMATALYVLKKLLKFNNIFYLIIYGYMMALSR